MKRKILTLIILAGLILTGSVSMLCSRKPVSQSERRQLAQWPELTGAKLLNGSFMSEAEKAAADQFPLRDGFRGMKAGFLYYNLGFLSNNGLFRRDGHIGKLEYPTRESSVRRAAERFRSIADTYFTGTDVHCYFSVIPDKTYFLSGSTYPTMDYSLLPEILAETTGFTGIDLYSRLSLEQYYRTDPHWKQESIVPTANDLLNAMGAFPVESLSETVFGSFRGSYAGQFALPVDAEDLVYLTGSLLDGCTATDLITGKEIPIYDLAGAAGQDPYDLYLGGAAPLQRIDNPNAPTDRDLILFRDSFGSSIAPLLACSYRSVTLVDLRYISSALLGNYLTFEDQDVLFLYSTLVLSNGETLK